MEFLNHIESGSGFKLIDIEVSLYKKWLQTILPLESCDDSPIGPKKTFAKRGLIDYIGKVLTFQFPPQVIPAKKEPELGAYEKALAREEKNSAYYQKELLRFRKEKPRLKREDKSNLTENQLIANKLDTSSGVVRSHRKRLKNWRML